MGKSLKEANLIPIALVCTVNIAVFLLLLKTGNLSFPNTESIIKEWKGIIPAGVGVILAGVINSLLSANAKARIVFWKWRDPLPASEAFSKYALSDHRVDIEALEKEFGQLPSDPKAQHMLWYKMYKKTENQPSVLQVYKSFLFCRDYAAISLMVFCIFSPVSLFVLHISKFSFVYSGLLLIQYIATMIAARNNGIRFVTNVMATCSTIKQ